MEDDDFDDLLGVSGPDEDEDDDDLLLDEDEDDLPRASGGKKIHKSLTEKGSGMALRGAPPGWFAAILGIGRTTVNRKLAGLAPKRVVARNTKLYDVREALPYLVQPHDIGDHIKRLNPKELPERLRREFWGARKLEQEVRLRSKDLWHTADVHRVLGDLMKLVKDTVNLWTDEVNEVSALSNEQVEILDNLARKLLSDFNEAVNQYCAQGVTRSQEAEFDEDFDAEA